MLNRKPLNVNTTSSYVQQKRKTLPYTVTAIGGREELGVWRKEQERQELEYQAGESERYANRRTRAIKAMGNNQPSFTEAELAEIAYVKSRSKRPSKAVQALGLDQPAPALIPPPHKPWWARARDSFKAACHTLWCNAFDSN